MTRLFVCKAHLPVLILTCNLQIEYVIAKYRKKIQNVFFFVNALNFFDEVSVVPAIEKLTFCYNDLKSTMVFTLFTIRKNIFRLLK